MATSSMDKGLYAAPKGLDEEDGVGIAVDIEAAVPIGEAGAEIEIEELEDGGVEISFGPSDDDDEEGEFGENLAELLDEGVLQNLSGDLVELIETDIGSRKEWADTFVKGMDVLGFKYEERTEPWDGACGVYSTVLAEAAIRFQAETMSETFPAAGPVKTKILGKVTKEKEDAAERACAQT
jgi:hypothetical protein